MILNDPVWPNRLTNILIEDKGRPENQNQRKRLKYAWLLTLKMEGGTRSQGTKMISRSWKRQGNGFSSAVF